MNREKLYHKTIGILTDAYFNGTLMASHCACCAVGNLVASNMGYRIEVTSTIIHWIDNKGMCVGQRWQENSGFLCGRYNKDSPNTKRQIESTGYQTKELVGIEDAFMACHYNFPQGIRGDELNFMRLMFVVDYLGIVHEVNTKTTSESKTKFAKEKVSM